MNAQSVPIHQGNITPESFELAAGQYKCVSSLNIAWGEGKKFQIGGLAACRYCEETGTANLRAFHSHTIPEFLGNDRAFSYDECLECNKKFGRYESELGRLVGPFMTIGGVSGKRGVPIQKGHDVELRSSNTIGSDGPGRSLFVSLANDEPRFGRARILPDGRLQTETPFPKASFVPRMAFKALAKCAVAILPSDELPLFSDLRKQLLTCADDQRAIGLHVALHLAELTNPLQATTAVILKRQGQSNEMPSALFAMTSGAVGFVINLLSDADIANVEFIPKSINYEPSVTLTDDTNNCAPIQIRWHRELLLDLSSPTKQVVPITGYWQTVGSFGSSWTKPEPVYTTLDALFGGR